MSTEAPKEETPKAAATEPAAEAPAAPAAPAEPAKAPPKPSLAQKIKGSGILDPFVDAATAIRFPNRHVRRISLLFIVSSIGVLVMVFLTLRHFKHEAARPRDLTQEEMARLHHEELERLKAEDLKRKAAMAELPRFMVDLRPMPGTKRGSSDRAEVQIIAQCDSSDTREYLEGREAEFRDLMSSAMSEMDRETLLTRDGKRQIRRVILDRMNRALPKNRGKVVDVFFAWLKVG